jgi:hypothetical protein
MQRPQAFLPLQCCLIITQKTGKGIVKQKESLVIQVVFFRLVDTDPYLQAQAEEAKKFSCLLLLYKHCWGHSHHLSAVIFQTDLWFGNRAHFTDKESEAVRG